MRGSTKLIGPVALVLAGVSTAWAGPIVTQSVTSLTWPTRELGEAPAYISFWFITSGDASTVFGQATITGPNADEFKQTYVDGCSGATFTPGWQCAVQVAFAPQTLGTKSATLSLPSNAPGSPNTVALSGKVVPDVTPPTADWTSPPAAGSARVSLIHSVRGNATDTAAGVETVLIYFNDSQSNITVATADVGPCQDHGHSCLWSVVVPLLAPGPGSAVAYARDAAGNWSSGASRSFLFV